MERLMPNLIPSAAEYLPVGAYLYSRGLDGAGMYRVTRVQPNGDVYGVLVEKEPLSKPWWNYNRDEGKPGALAMAERRELPDRKVKAKKRSKKDLSERGF